MVYMCDICHRKRSMVYCSTEASCFCLSCDHNVHFNNPFSDSHSRNLICQRCNEHPKSVTLTLTCDNEYYICQKCDWLDSNPKGIIDRSSVQQNSSFAKDSNISSQFGSFISKRIPNFWIGYDGSMTPCHKDDFITQKQLVMSRSVEVCEDEFYGKFVLEEAKNNVSSELRRRRISYAERKAARRRGRFCKTETPEEYDFNPLSPEKTNSE